MANIGLPLTLNGKLYIMGPNREHGGIVIQSI